MRHYFHGWHRRVQVSINSVFSEGARFLLPQNIPEHSMQSLCEAWSYGLPLVTWFWSNQQKSNLETLSTRWEYTLHGTHTIHTHIFTPRGYSCSQATCQHVFEDIERSVWNSTITQIVAWAQAWAGDSICEAATITVSPPVNMSLKYCNSLKLGFICIQKWVK